MQKNEKKNKIAFVASLYQENNFTSGGVKLNYILLEYLKKNDYFNFDVYAKEYDNDVKLPDEIFDCKNFDKNVAKSYQYVLSEKGICPSDVTYLHDHSNKFRYKFLYKKWYFFFYKLFSRKKYLKRKAVDEKIKQNLQNTKKIIVSSKVLKNDCIRNYDIDTKKIYILPPPVAYQLENQSVKNEKFVFGFSATGFERKGGYVVLKAVKKLKKQKNFDFKVKIILKKKNLFIKFLIYFYGIANYIEFVPIQKNMCEFYNSIDCLLMPSLLEPFGMVATEVMMNSKPVIVSKISGVSDVVIDGFNGLVTNNYNLDEKMKQMIEMSNKNYQKMCKNAYNSVADFTSENFAKKYLKILAQ